MSRPKKEQRKADYRGQENALGYDYGIPPKYLLVSPPEFTQLLSDADTFAVAYGSEPNWKYGSIPALTLVARHATPLTKAFEEFQRWTDSSDGDSVQLSFLFLNKGGYAIGISPEITRLRTRILGFDRVHEPLYFAATWIKILDTRNPLTDKFRQYCQRLVSPFTLRAACYRGVMAGQTPDPLLFEKLPGVKPILKFGANFSDENNVEPNTQYSAMLESVRSIGMGKKIKHSPRQPTSQLIPAHILETREKMLRKHFPVTLLRLRGIDRFRTYTASLKSKGIASWQINQAICNLLLSFEMTGGHHFFKDVSPKEFIDRLASSLSAHFEEANGIHDQLNKLNEEMIGQQIILDSIALLKHAGIKPKQAHLPTLLTELTKRGFMPPSDKDE